MNNFYQDTKIKIEELINKGELAMAKQLILEELAMPYIPQDFENALLEFLPMCQTEKQVQIISDEDSLNKLLMGDVEDVVLAIESLRKLNCRNYKDILLNYFKDSDNSPIRGILIDVLIEQQLHLEFTCFSKGKEVMFNPSLLSHPYLTEGFILCEKYLEDHLFNDYPSELNFTKEILITYVYNLMPAIIDVSFARELANLIIYLVFKQFGNLAMMGELFIEEEKFERGIREHFSSFIEIN